jgi:hypothetical protein
LLARLFESLPLVWPYCGVDMRILAYITEAAPVRRTRPNSLYAQQK